MYFLFCFLMWQQQRWHTPRPWRGTTEPIDFWYGGKIGIMGTEFRNLCQKWLVRSPWYSSVLVVQWLLLPYKQLTRVWFWSVTLISLWCHKGCRLNICPTLTTLQKGVYADLFLIKNHSNKMKKSLLTQPRHGGVPTGRHRGQWGAPWKGSSTRHTLCCKI